jgi:hypothetical protein
MLLNLNKTIKAMDGKDLEGELNLMSKVVCERIGISAELSEPVKFWGFAESLRDTGEITIDSTDVDKLVKFIESDKSLVCFAKAQILKEITNQRLSETVNK